MSIIDHVNLPVSDLKRSRLFYETVLEPLGYRILLQDGFAVGFGLEAWNFGIIEMKMPFPSIHLAFKAATQGQVQRFHQAALQAGARSNGAPGVRQHYDPAYFSAFVIDPDGHNIEAVHRG